MEKKILSLLIMFIVFFGMKSMNAQQIDVETFYLDNGLKVVLCEDHSAPTIYGTVYVHVGSKNDPLDATGMAHYFEHIMFKGTDKIGTTDWEKEKIYLDSIDIMYDKLHETDIAEERAEIQQKINELSLASTDYAIPNEVDLILKRMGGTNLNAGTSFDYTVYYNSFPSNQIEKWMDVYVERFRNPVFRLFQSELETVYEEKNMYSDSPVSAFSEMMYKECFGEHPYGRPIVGLTEHLKNPQTSKMREFFNTYYVANNMTLILVGDFDTEEIKPMVEDKFGVWRSGELPEKVEYELPTFDKEIVKEVRMTPIKMGTIIYKGINQSHEDNIALEFMSGMLSNGSTGIIDKAMLNNELMMAVMSPLSLEDHGAVMFLYMPKFIGQSHEEAESIIFDALAKIQNGDFSDDLFEAVKTETLKHSVQRLEGIENLALLIVSLETQGMSIEDFYAEIEKIKNLTKEDIVAVANRYFTENRTIIRSKMGFPEKDKVEKPNWKAVEVKNTEMKSEFAEYIESKEVSEVEPQVIEFGEDVIIEDANDAFVMYSSKNPYNNIFNLRIMYNYGLYNNPDLDKADYLWSMFGTESRTYEEFELELQKMGAYVTTNVSGGSTILYISGFEENLDRILSLCEDKIFNVKYDESKMELLVEEQKTAEKLMKTSPDSWGNALYEYVIYGDKSNYLNKTPMKEWAKRNPDDIIADFKEIFNYGGNVVFTGNIDTKEVIEMLNSHNIIKNDAIKTERKIRKPNVVENNMVYFIHSKKLRQSNIEIYVQGEKLNEKEEAVSNVFNKYFGTDMYSIVFQEIRELRSLGYSAYSYYSYDYLNRYPGCLYAYLGTQSDKTNEAVDAMLELIVNMPEKMEKFNTSKDALIMSRAASYISPRYIPYNVISWTEMGYDHDPRMETTKYIKETSYEDIYEFYQSKIQNHPIVIMISGNKKDMNLKALKQYGEVKELKLKDVYKRDF